MMQIKNLDKITSIYKDWKPTDLAFIKDIKWIARDLIIVFYSQLRNNVIGWPDLSKLFFEISMNFENVSNYKFEVTNSGIHQITGFDIINISNVGLEGINFQIEDYENGIISFNCEDISINFISDPITISLNSG